MPPTFHSRSESNRNMTLLLMVVFTVFIILVGSFLGYLTGMGSLLTGIALVIALVMNFFSYYYSDKISIAMVGAQPADPRKHKLAFEAVESMAIASGIPQPKIFIINDGMINAFASGRDEKHSVIAITTGSLEKLTKYELQGVVAHEMSHIKNRDILVMSVAVALVGVIVFLADIAWRSMIFGGRNRNNRMNAATLVVGLVLIILAPLLAQMIKFAISRKREYLADSDGALLTRYPDALASALQKIKKDPEILEAANSATAHLFFANPFKNPDWFSRLFMTHPPIDERIKILRGIKV